MLVATMNRAEVTAEVAKDFKKLRDITMLRLMDEYDRERRKLKINKTKVYNKAYPIKTAAKNNWIVFIEKSPVADSYKSIDDANFCCIVYYYSKKGLLVFRPDVNRPGLEVFYGHVFTRYNQRLHLNLKNQVDVMKSYFSSCGYSNGEIREKNGKKFSVCICKEGMLLGNYHTDPVWLIHKTFISKDLKREDQDEQEKRLMSDLEIAACGVNPRGKIHIGQQNRQQSNEIYIQITGKKTAPATKKAPLPDIPVFVPDINLNAAARPWQKYTPLPLLSA